MLPDAPPLSASQQKHINLKFERGIESCPRNSLLRFAHPLWHWLHVPHAAATPLSQTPSPLRRRPPQLLQLLRLSPLPQLSRSNLKMQSKQEAAMLISLTDSGWWAQYWGNTEPIANGLNLCYDAGVVHIDGDGQYTVSVTCDTKGARFDGTGDANGELVVSGVGFSGVIIKDGETVCPDAVITVDSIVIDGEEIELTGTNYTCFEEGAVRTNLYNEWVSDANCPEGTTAQIFDRDKIGAWSTVEVNFTISGLGEGSGSSEGETTDAENTEEATEETTTTAAQ